MLAIRRRRNIRLLASACVRQLLCQGVARLTTPKDPQFVKQLKSVAVGDEPKPRVVSTISSMRRYALGFAFGVAALLLYVAVRAG